MGRLTGEGFEAPANSFTETMGDKLVNSLDKLANAAVAKNDTIERLIKAGATKDETIAALTKDISRLTGLIAKKLETPGAGWSQPPGAGGAAVWDPKGYCWTHGYKVRVGHNSKTCTKRAKGHQEEATRDNIMGGRTWGINWKPKA